MAEADFPAKSPRAARKKSTIPPQPADSPADSWGTNQLSASMAQRKAPKSRTDQDAPTIIPAPHRSRKKKIADAPSDAGDTLQSTVLPVANTSKTPSRSPNNASYPPSQSFYSTKRSSAIPTEIHISLSPTAPLSNTAEVAQLSETSLLPARVQTTGPIMIIPGNHRAHMTTDHRLPIVPKTRERQRKKMHLLVVISMLAVVMAIMISITPINRAFAAPTSHWLAFANMITPPTPTATPSPTPIPPPVYVNHPVAGGAYGFICTALPFARLAYNDMINSGMAHPWYVSFILAQWGVEGGWSMPTYTGYNFGNVSALAGYPAIGGINVPGSPSAFAYAYTPLQGVTYYVIYAQMRLYTGVTAAYPQGPYAQAYAMGASPWDAGHYAVNGQYGAKLVNAMNAFNLTRFDNPAASC